MKDTTVIILLFLGFSPGIFGQESGWEPLKTAIRGLREKKKVPTWAGRPHLRHHDDLNSYLTIQDVLHPPQRPNNNEEYPDSDALPLFSPPSLKELRYGDINDQEMDLLNDITHSTFSPAQNHIPQTLMAHGIEEAKGGITNLINIMIEGHIFGAAYGPLVRGNPSLNAGNHGPFFVIVDDSHLNGSDNFIGEKAHAGYLVPGERHRQKMISFLTVALQKGLLTWEEKMALEGKVLTYQEFASMAKSHPQAMKKSDLFGKALQAFKEKKDKNKMKELVKSVGLLISSSPSTLPKCSQQ